MTAPAVIVIDLQVGMTDGLKFPPLHGAETVLANARSVIAWGRAKGAPVAFIRHDGAPGEALAPGEPGWPVNPALGARDDEPVFSKRVGDAFAPGELEPWLRERAVDQVILLGAATDQCVNATLAGALERGFDVTVVSDAHSTMDFAGETASQIIARHNAQFAAAGARTVATQVLVSAPS
jgi:nicotinamidase-related amidase